MLKVFRRFAEEEILSDQHIDKFAMSHPSSSDRIETLQSLVEASPYRDAKDSAQSVYAYAMVRAKLRGYIQDPQSVLFAYPLSDTSKAARYARAMAYFRMPDMEKAQAEIDGLVRDEPNNPYFLEMQGQILVARGKVIEGIEPYRRAVHILPDAPQIRVALAAAMLGTENPSLAAQAQVELQTALRQDDDDAFAWYKLAQAYALQGQEGKAQLATAEQHIKLEDYKGAMRFAYLAQQKLLRGSTDWQRASDIILVSQTQAPAQPR
jgi:predicted Zn-dependent protease